MKTIGMSKARNSLPGLIESLLQSKEQIMVLRHGKPVARISPVSAEANRRNPYPLRGVPIRMSKDFNKPMSNLWESLAS